MRNRRARRADKNQPDIVDEIRALGGEVQHTYTVGDGVVDLIVGAYGLNACVEVKPAPGPGVEMKQTRLLPTEQDVFDKWPGQITIVRDERDVARLLATMERLRGVLDLHARGHLPRWFEKRLEAA